MKTKKFEVIIYYAGFCTHLVSAGDQHNAVRKAGKSRITSKELLGNVKSWKEPNTADEIKGNHEDAAEQYSV